MLQFILLQHLFLPECDKVTYKYMPSQIRLSSSVTFLHPTQPVEIFDNIFTRFCIWPSADLLAKFYGDRLRGTPPLDMSKAIMETVQDTASGTIND